MKLKTNLASNLVALFSGRGKDREETFKAYVAIKRRIRRKKQSELKKSNQAKA